MTPSEFKAFLDGMDVGDAPTPEQWTRIREKIEAIDAVPPSDWLRDMKPPFPPPYGYDYWPNTCKVTVPFDPNVTVWSNVGMEPLGADFERVWDENTDKLYEA